MNFTLTIRVLRDVLALLESPQMQTLVADVQADLAGSAQPGTQTVPAPTVPPTDPTTPAAPATTVQQADSGFRRS